MICSNLVPLKGENQVGKQWRRIPVYYRSTYPAGTIIIDTSDRYLYLLIGPGKAIRYGVAVGRDGYTWEGSMKVTRKAEWPDWRPPADMIAREKKKGKTLPAVVQGGPGNPLGARALYLGSSEYRIHGTNAPKSIGQNASSGCIRMLNEHVIDLYAKGPSRHPRRRHRLTARCPVPPRCSSTHCVPPFPEAYRSRAR